MIDKASVVLPASGSFHLTDAFQPVPSLSLSPPRTLAQVESIANESGCDGGIGSYPTDAVWEYTLSCRARSLCLGEGGRERYGEKPIQEEDGAL